MSLPPAGPVPASSRTNTASTTPPSPATSGGLAGRAARPFGLLLLGGAVVVLSACGNGREAGNSLETENAVASKILPVDSLLPAWNRPRERATVATLRLDRWNFPFEHSSRDGRDLSVETAAGMPVPFRLVDWDSSRAMGRLQVRLEGAVLQSGSSIRLRWGLERAPRTDSAGVWAAIPDSQRQVLTSALVGDFENAGTRTPLAIATSWYGVATESTSVLAPGVGPDTVGWAGSVLQTTFHADTTKYRYVVVGIDLKGPRSLRSMDSLVMRVRGTGRLSVAFDHLEPGASRKAWMHFQLRSAWRRLRIRPSDLLPPNPALGDNVGWDAVRDSVTHLTFLLGGGPDFQVDDIRFHGLDRDDFR